MDIIYVVCLSSEFLLTLPIFVPGLRADTALSFITLSVDSPHPSVTDMMETNSDTQCWMECLLRASKCVAFTYSQSVDSLSGGQCFLYEWLSLGVEEETLYAKTVIAADKPLSEKQLGELGSFWSPTNDEWVLLHTCSLRPIHTKQNARVKSIKIVFFTCKELLRLLF